MSRYEWMESARCAQVDPDLWHADSSVGYAQAKQICAGCPVRSQCQAHVDRFDAGADGHGRHGMWAGRTKKDRGVRLGDSKRVERDTKILHLIERGGMDVEEIAGHVGCSARTVWRVQRAYREQMGRAA